MSQRDIDADQNACWRQALCEDANARARRRAHFDHYGSLGDYWILANGSPSDAIAICLETRYWRSHEARAYVDDQRVALPKLCLPCKLVARDDRST